MARVICFLVLCALIAYSYAEDTTAAPATTAAATTAAATTAAAATTTASTPSSDASSPENPLAAFSNSLLAGREAMRKKESEWDTNITKGIADFFNGKSIFGK